MDKGMVKEAGKESSSEQDEETAIGSTRWRTSITRRNALGNAIAVPVLRRLLSALRDHLTGQ